MPQVRFTDLTPEQKAQALVDYRARGVPADRGWATFQSGGLWILATDDDLLAEAVRQLDARDKIPRATLDAVAEAIAKARYVAIGESMRQPTNWEGADATVKNIYRFGAYDMARAAIAAYEAKP